MNCVSISTLGIPLAPRYYNRLVPILYKDVTPNPFLNLMWRERIGFIIPGGPPLPRTASARWPRPWRRSPPGSPQAAAAAAAAAAREAPPTNSLFPSFSKCQ